MTGIASRGVAERIRLALADPYSRTSVGARLRRRRWEVFAQHFPDIGAMSVLDLGGTAENWVTAPVRPAHVVLVNLEHTGSDLDWLTEVVGDACEPSREVAGRGYDLVYSNSLIEHVGGHYRRRMLADIVRREAPRHWVQTPYRYFPIEPHWLCPGFQYLPLRARVALNEHWPLAWSRSAGQEGVGNVLDVELLSRTEMRYYFPESDLSFENVAGVPKSLIASL